LPAGISAYDSKTKKMKRSSSKHNQSKENNKFSSRRLSSNHEEMQVQLSKDHKPQINNLMSSSEKSSPKKTFNSTAHHPSQASYKKLTDVQNSNKMNLNAMLEKSKKSAKVSRSSASKQHNTSGQPPSESKIAPNMFQERKNSADGAVTTERRTELNKASIDNQA